MKDYNRNQRRSGVTFVFWCVATVVVSLGGGASAQLDAQQRLKIVRSQTTGRVSFVAARNGEVLPVSLPQGQARPQAVDCLVEYGPLLGATNPRRQFAEVRAWTDSLRMTHTTFEQTHKGIPVFSGVFRVHQDEQGNLLAVNGDVYDIRDTFDVRPTVSTGAAVALAREALDKGAIAVERSELVIVDPGWYGDPPIGAHLAYYIILNDPSAWIREALFIDARTGTVLDQWSMLDFARQREIYDAQGDSVLPGVLVRAEGDPPVPEPADVDPAYDYAGDTYDYFWRAFARDSIDDLGMPLIVSVNFYSGICPNAFWNGSQMTFCEGAVTDDIMAHEITHGVTEYTAELIYQNQPGQLNESYSDVFGELVDLFNGDVSLPGPPAGPPYWPPTATGPGTDTPNNLRSTCSLEPDYLDGYRWLAAEDAAVFGGAIRDMWDPTCAGDPDKVTSPLLPCGTWDQGGVHSGSGIPNHAFAMATDGKTFNGFVVNGIGPIKAAAVWYRALTTYLTPASDFIDAYAALNQAALDLVGTIPVDPRTGAPSGSTFTAADANEVDQALQAVEMNIPAACGATPRVLLQDLPPLCSMPSVIYADDFEGGINDWTVSNLVLATGPVYDWAQTEGLLPHGRPGIAWACDDPVAGDCSFDDASSLHYLTSPPITIPGGASGIKLTFAHHIASDEGWDGGRVLVRVNGDPNPWQAVDDSAFDYNGYNSELIDVGNPGPLAGESVWTGTSRGWGTSVIDVDQLASGGDTIEVRFEFAIDDCTGVLGWFVDDFEILDCP